MSVKPAKSKTKKVQPEIVTALGRQEEWEDSPEGYPESTPYEWWNWHDEYGNDEASARVLEQVRRGRAAGADGDTA